MNLYERKNYTLPIKNLFNSYIREYDISKANINILLYKGIISEEEYVKLSMLSRRYRQVQIGYILKDERINTLFEDGLKEVRKNFIEMNGLGESDILSIKNDAIYVINKIPCVTKFGNVEFVLKNTYTSYMKLRDLEVYYGLNKQTESEVIDIKGINDKKLELHKDHMIQIICDSLYFISTGDNITVLDYISDIYKKYLNKSLPMEYYKTFDSMSMYNVIIGGYRYGLEHLSPTEENYGILDISYNAGIIRELYYIIYDYILGGRK